MSRGLGRFTHRPTLELLEGPAAEVDAGTAVRFAVRAACPSLCDVGALPLVVEGPGADLVELVPTRRSDACCDTRVVLRAPAEPGPASWTLRLPEHGSGGIRHEGVELRVSTEVVPHRTSVAIWQVPSPLKGSSFSVRVGVKCSARCSLGGERVQVLAESREWLGGSTLGAEPRPGSDGLYEADVSLVAPDESGVFLCRAQFEGRGLELPHQAAEAAFSFRALEPPECAVTVRVVPDALAVPLAGIEVRLGPYHGETDAYGVARVDVPKGTHALSLWRIDIAPVSIEVDVAGDTELRLAPVPRRLVDADAEREWM